MRIALNSPVKMWSVAGVDVLSVQIVPEPVLSIRLAYADDMTWENDQITLSAADSKAIQEMLLPIIAKRLGVPVESLTVSEVPTSVP